MSFSVVLQGASGLGSLRITCNSRWNNTRKPVIIAKKAIILQAVEVQVNPNILNMSLY